MSDREVVIVTGAAKGLGRAYATALARKGYAVVVADLSSGDAVVDEIGTAGGTATAVRVDVSDRESADAMAAATIERFGRIDAIVNNAATSRRFTSAPSTS